MFRCGKPFYIDVGNIKLNVYDSAEKCSYREKLALIFLHGLPGQISNWKHQVEYFERKYRIIVYDQRGFGISDKPKKVSLNDYLQDLDKIIESRKLNTEDTILIGHSFGGMVAQAYARTHKVKGLVLIGSLTKIKPDIFDKIIWYLPPIFWRKILYKETPLTRRLYRRIFFSPSTPKEVFEEFIKDNKEYLERLPAYVFRYTRFFIDYDATKWLHEIKVPTLIIVGRDDKVTPVSESKLLNKLIPNSRLIIIEDAGHLVLYEKPSELNGIIEEFIRELKYSM